MFVRTNRTKAVTSTRVLGWVIAAIVASSVALQSHRVLAQNRVEAKVGTPLSSFRAHEPARPTEPWARHFIVFSPDGQKLISGGAEKSVKVWNVGTGELEATLVGHSAGVRCAAISEDGKLLVTGSVDHSIGIWDLAIGKSEKFLQKKHLDSIDAVAISPDARTIASAGSDRVFVLWNVRREPRFSSPAQELPVNRIAFSPDGLLLATGTGDVLQWKEPGEVKLWDVRTGEERDVLLGHSSCVGPVVFSPDGQLLATGTADGTLRLWDVAARTEVLAKNFGTGVRAIAFLGNGSTLAIGQWPGRVFLWDSTTGQREANYLGHQGQNVMVESVAVSPDGTTVASTGTDGMVHLWAVPDSTRDGERPLWHARADGKPTTAETVRQWAAAPNGNPAAKDQSDN
jgi:WD40 repeat protein